MCTLQRASWRWRAVRSFTSTVHHTPCRFVLCSISGDADRPALPRPSRRPRDDPQMRHTSPRCHGLRRLAEYNSEVCPLFVHDSDATTSMIRVCFQILSFPDMRLGNPQLRGVHSMIMRRVRERRTQRRLKEARGLLVRNTALRDRLLDGEAAYNMRHFVQLLRTNFDVA